MKSVMWSFYDLKTGEICSRRISTTAGVNLEKVTPAGCAPIRGRYDRRVQRVDVATGAVVERVRPQNEIDAEARHAARMATLERIRQLEDQQARPLREIALDPTAAAPRERLAALDAQIAGLRKSL